MSSGLLELFSGIGAAGRAWGGSVVGAIDQNPHANATYRANHGLAPRAWNLAGVTAAQLSAFQAERWWLSPPCQPFTVRGARRDLEDPRVKPLLRVLAILCELRPPVVAMENVPGFVASATRGELRAALIAAGYTLDERLLCPTSLGVPMRRQRYYLVARLGRDGGHRSQFETPAAAPPARPLVGFLDEVPEPALYVSEALISTWGHSVNILEAKNPTAVATCFTSAYGRSPVRSGSYLRDGGGVRYFSPEEILRLMGFPGGFAFPAGLDRHIRWDLAGNTLSVDAVRSLALET